MKLLDKNVVLIGLDGATFTILNPMMENGTMPFLRSMMDSSARGDLLSVIPPLTPPGWTSMITGRSPGNHGITNFMQRRDPSSQLLNLISSRDLACETLYSVVNRQGMRAGSLNFPAMSPAPPVDGYVLPGWVSWRWLRRNSHPKDLIDRLKAIPEVDLKTLAVKFEEEGKAVVGCEQGEYEEWIRLHIRREEQWFRVLTYLMKNDPCGLTTVVFDGVDRLQHLCWRFLDPQCVPENPSPWETQVIDLLHEYFRHLDHFIAEIVGLAGPEATVLIASDHGFAGSVEILNINCWLEQQGLLRWKTGIARSDEYVNDSGPNMVLNAIDWEHTKAYASTLSSNGIFIQVAEEPGQGGVRPEDYQSFRQDLITALRERCVDPAGEPLVTNVWTREEAFAGPRQAIAPDLTLSLRDNGFISIRAADAYYQPRPEVFGTHAPEGVLIAMGPGIRQGVALPPCSILDVAPILLYSLDLPIPEDFEGVVPEGVFEPTFMASRPVRFGEATQPVAQARSGDATTEADASTSEPEGEDEVMIRLKALGYVE